MKTKITIDKNFIFSSAYEEYKYLLKYMPEFPEGNPSRNYNVPGISDYPFYSYFSGLVDNTTILEIGTCLGGSAVMMSHNITNKIISYDVVDRLEFFKSINRNIEFRVGDFMQDSSINYDEVRLISIDAAHDGHSEKNMLEYLENIWEGGLVYMDDIRLIGVAWDNIDKDRHEVFDITEISHGINGSGLINFNRYYDLNFIE